MKLATLENKTDEYKKIDKIINKHKNEKGTLVHILTETQQLIGYLPQRVQCYIAKKLELSPANVNSVVSFYSYFTQKPRGKHLINVCLGTACYVKGANDLLSSIKNELNIEEGGTTIDKRFTLESTRCIGACSIAPVIMIDDDVHGKLTPEDIPALLHSYVKRG